MARHIPVLLNEVVGYLEPGRGGRFLDGTVGLGGHCLALLEAGPVEMLGLDRDRQALDEARERLKAYSDRVRLAHARFSSFEAEMERLGWELLDGALLDLGVSSLHLDEPERGFSFTSDGPLDMRMDPGGGEPPASVLVNKASKERLKAVIRDLGEEPMAGRIAKAIVDARAKAPIETTGRLAEIVYRAYPGKWRATARQHPATRTFMALRMAVNKEIEELEIFMDRIADRLAPKARLVLISFHSREDRIVKQAFKREAKGCVCPDRQPICTCGRKPRLKILTKKPVTPGEEEIRANPRSRSAKLRAAERLFDPPGGDAA